MRNRIVFLIGLLGVSAAYADSYDALLKRYEKQIHQQERQLKALRKSLMDKEKEADDWMQKADTAKSEWSKMGNEADQARSRIVMIQQTKGKVHAQAEAAQWSAVQRNWVGQSANSELRFLAADVYKRRMTPRYLADYNSADKTELLLVDDLASVSQSSHLEAAQAQQQELALRNDELRWQMQEQARNEELAKLHQKQRTAWLNWQDALRRRSLLEEEKNQLEESAQAMRVMITALQQHHEEALSAKREEAGSAPASLQSRGSLPWPAEGAVVQNFGRQYSPELQQLVVSNGIKIEAPSGESVRAVEAGKVLFASPFDQYGQLVIVQHHHGLTSIYGGLTELQVKEGDVLAALDSIGKVGEAKSFYFELRRDEAPVNPLVWLAPPHRSELTSRRKFQ